MTSGIYKITNRLNGKFYIGSSSNVKKRFKSHIHDLKCNRHHSNILQNAWNKYGENGFIFETIENVLNEKNKLLEREQFYLDLWEPFDRSIGYNICELAYSRLGSKVSEETKKKTRGENSPVSKLIQAQVDEIRKKYDSGNCTQAQLAKEYKVDNKTISSIVRNLSWVDESRKHLIVEFKRQPKGKDSPMFGKKLSEETKKKISEKQKGVRTGESNPAAKLNWDTVNKIRKKYEEEKITCKKLSEIFGLKKGHVQRIINNELWKDDKWIKPNRENRGQNQSGQNNPASVITWEAVRKIRDGHHQGISQRQLSKIYGYPQGNISKIVRNLIWVE